MTLNIFSRCAGTEWIVPHVIVSSLSSEDWSLGESIQGVNFYSVYNTKTKKLDLNSDLDSEEIGMFEVVTVNK